MLASDLEAQRDDLVSFVATPDPFGSYTLADLERAFPNGVVHFKDHHVADLAGAATRSSRRAIARRLKRRSVNWI